jgi:PST family polysaccharide transporter
MELFNSSIGMVVVPALSRLQRDVDRLRRTFLECYSLVLLATIPVPFICGTFAWEIVQVVLGPKWIQAASILRALAPTILAFALMNPFSWFLMPTARNRLSIGLALLVPPAVIMGVVSGLPHGPLGVALGYSFGVNLVAVPIIMLCRAATGIPWRELWGVVRRPLWASLLATACGVGLKLILHGAAPPLLTLIAGLCTIFAIYAWTLLMVFGQKDYYQEIVRSMFHSSRRNGTSEPIGLGEPGESGVDH